jgi:hypothetical protein
MDMPASKIDYLSCRKNQLFPQVMWHRHVNIRIFRFWASWAAQPWSTVTRIDGILHQPHGMAPDQTIRLMGDKFDISDGHIQFFPTFPMEIFDRFEVFRLNSLYTGWKCRRFEVFRLYSLYTGWKSSTFRSFPIIFPLQRMEIDDLFEDFRLYSLFKGWKYPTIRNFLFIFPIKGRKSLNFTAKKITSNKSFVQFYYAHTCWTIVFNV